MLRKFSILDLQYVKKVSLQDKNNKCKRKELMGRAFNFKGGEYLTTIGACWFVSYSYYKKIDSTHTNWQEVETWPDRVRTFQRTMEYHEYWLEQVLNMNDLKLNTNKIHLKASQVKQMAKILLKCKEQ
ncbi:hypothetical protein Barb6_03642 [Bacteroidales bacterium Barb6]|nr:hypothetical protein Barb6_03642 [Bacteroidales bacterium Barb6]